MTTGDQHLGGRGVETCGSAAESGPMSEPTAPPLLVTEDEALRAELVRLSAAAGVVLDLVRDVDEALLAFPRSALVLIGTDVVDRVAASHPGRRPQVYVVGRQAPADDVFRAALGCGADAVLTLPEAASSLVDLLTDAGNDSPSDCVVVGVIGGAGGVGSTTFAVALAQVLAERGPALLVDTDGDGAGVDRLLGIEAESGVRWDALMQSAGRLSSRALREALPRRHELSVLTWPVDRSRGLSTAAVREVLAAARRGYPGVVVDLPRRSDPIAEEVLARCDEVLLVSTMTLPAVSAAVRVGARLPGTATRLVLRGRAAGLQRAEVERLLGLPVAAAMTDQRRLDEAVSLGLGPLRSRGPLARAAREVADGLVPGRGARR